MLLVLLALPLASVLVDNPNAYAATIYKPLTLPEPASTPWAIAVDPVRNLVYVEVGYANGIAVLAINGSNDNVVATVPINDAFFPEGLAVNPVTGYLYAVSSCTGIPPGNTACSGEGAVYAINTDAMKVVANVSQAEPWAVAVNPTNDMLYVVNGGGCCGGDADSVAMINATSLSVVKAVPIGGTSAGAAVDVDTATDRVYVVSQDVGVLVFDGNMDSLVATIETGQTPSAVAVDSITDTVYVADYSSDTVTVINGTTDRVAATVPVGKNPYGIAVNPVTDGVYVADFASDDVDVVNGVNDLVVQTLPTGSGSDPKAVAVDPATDTAYVADAGPYPAEVSVVFDNTIYTSQVTTVTIPTDRVTVGVSSTLITPDSEFTVSGVASAASGSVSGTDVNITVDNPAGVVVDQARAPVSGSGPVGPFSVNFTAGIGQGWITGYYLAKAAYASVPSGTPATANFTFTYESAAPAPGPAVIQATSNELGSGSCDSSPCHSGFINPVSAGDGIVAAVGLQCAPSCSGFSFTDSLGTSFQEVVASNRFSCAGQNGTLYAVLAYGNATEAGPDAVQVAFSGNLQTETSLDIMETSDAPFLVAGTNLGLSGQPQLNESLYGAVGDVFIEFATFTQILGPTPNGCDQSGGSSQGWSIWGGINIDYGLYNTGLASSNFPYPPFSVDDESWVEVGAIFGTYSPPPLVTTTVTSTSTSFALVTSTLTSKTTTTSTVTSTLVSTQTEQVLTTVSGPSVTLTATSTLTRTESSQSTSSGPGFLASLQVLLAVALLIAVAVLGYFVVRELRR